MTTPENPAPGLLPGQPVGMPAGMLRIHRSQLVVVAAIGLVLGLIGIVFPGASLLTVAIVFGIYLIASGVFRLTAAFIADRLTPGLRWLGAVLGLLVIAAGVVCLSNPFQSLVVLALVIGIGWIAEGVVDFMAALRRAVTPRWLGFLSGIISIGAGVAMFVLPAAGLVALVSIGSILLIVVSVTTLLTLPRDRTSKAPKAQRAAKSA